MHNLECLVGQLIAGVADLKDEIKDLKGEMKELRVEMKKDTDALEVDVHKLVSLRDKGAGIFLSTGVFFTFIGWGISRFLGE